MHSRILAKSGSTLGRPAAWLTHFYACCIVLLASGCSQKLTPPIPAAHPEEETPRRGGILELASSGDIRSLDPATIGDGIAPQIIHQIFAGLLDYDDKGTLRGDLAEKWEVLDEGLRYRFTLKQGVRFHDGGELTANDVKRSMERALSPKTPNPSRSFYAMIAGMAELEKGPTANLEGVQVVGTHVLDIRLTSKDATFLPVMALESIRPVCKSAGANYRADFVPCGTGPFRFVAWERGQRVVLRRNEAYFHPGQPYLDGVHFNFATSYVAQRLKFEEGKQDLLREFLQPDLLRFQHDPAWIPFGEFEAAKQMAGEGMNVEMAPFDNIEVRRAVASAINREQYALVKPSVMRALDGPIPHGVSGYDPALQCQKYDLAAARDHMRKAGFAYDEQTGKGGYPKTIAYYTYAQALPEFTAQLLQQQLAQIGIRIELRMTSYAAWLALSHRRNTAPLSYQGWSMDYSDPNDFLEPIFHSNAINDEDSNNSSFYRNPQFDGLIDAAHGELNPAARKGLYDRALRLLCDDAPWAFTYSVRFYNLRQPYVRGYHSHPMWTYELTRTWLDRSSSNESSRSALFAPARVLPRESFR